MSLRKRIPLPLVAGVAALLIAGCGGSSSHRHPSASAPARFAGGVLDHPFPAPPVSLRDSLGRPVQLSDYRGKVVLLTFLYVHCPDVCPLIAGHLHTVEQQLGSQASKVQLVTISADPRGDTPRTVATFLRQHQLTGQMEYLLGTRVQLAPVWKEWNIAAQPDSSGSNLVAHSALVYGITASGYVRTIYPANFHPADIVHDVPLLASL